MSEKTIANLKNRIMDIIFAAEGINCHAGMTSLVEALHYGEETGSQDAIWGYLFSAKQAYYGAVGVDVDTIVSLIDEAIAATDQLDQ